MWRMNSFVSLLMLATTLLAVKPFPVNPMQIQTDSSSSSSSSNSTATVPNPGQNFSLTPTLRQLVGAVQAVHVILRRHGDLAPFEYCFLQNIANPPSSNLTIEDRLLINYQVLNELTTPLRDVVNYEAHISNDSDTYNWLVSAQGQLNFSLEDMTNIQSSNQLMEKLLNHRSYQNSEHNTNCTLTNNNTTVSQNRCTDVIMNSTDEFRDLFEIYLGLSFAFMDLLDIQHELA